VVRNSRVGRHHDREPLHEPKRSETAGTVVGGIGVVVVVVARRYFFWLS
jgi:hypothetical protein